ncbi:MAG TPA: hypothetical protein VM802_20310 [Chitinophaga sp.]|uniref:hypothetical protein n=1 Tax=Chitinophaga sp. TaxID=1869181 RepID=UPI002C295029|nr:hypothetical protein [Chitinophaga sp.]HVI47233.1 hypothetical protein [Chitinophaga sp.]
MNFLEVLRSKKISATEAQKTLEKREEITGKMELVLKAFTDATKVDQVCAYYQNKSNGYLFETSDLLEIINGAKYVMIILGAHLKKEKPFKEGDPTVMIIPCEAPETKNQDKDGRIILMAKNKENEVGLEHPPSSVVGKVEGNQLTFEFVKLLS